MSRDKAPVTLIGIVLFALGGVLFTIKMVAEWDTVTVLGTVTSVHEYSVTDSTGTTTYFQPTISFKTESGDTASGIIHYNQSRVKYAVGDQREIRYKREDVNQIHALQSFWWYVPFLAVAAAGIGVIYFGIKFTSEWD